MEIESIKKKDLLHFIENEANFHIGSFIEGAIELAEEVHLGVKREDGTSSFLETHIWPVTMNVVRHYISANKPMTPIQIVSAILHDVLEDDHRILDLYASKAYGFDAYFDHRFGSYVYKTATILKTKPLEIYQGSSDEEKEFERFRDYCNVLQKSDYDVKVIKLADRLNNMRFMTGILEHEKITRYLREAEDFYLAYPILNPHMIEFYKDLRKAYGQLRKMGENVQDLMAR
jgi:(p)ppGpp synthase/HD superfamily hydrolase